LALSYIKFESSAKDALGLLNKYFTGIFSQNNEGPNYMFWLYLVGRAAPLGGFINLSNDVYPDRNRSPSGHKVRNCEKSKPEREGSLISLSNSTSYEKSMRRGI
jgi:hypothetical protein